MAHVARPGYAFVTAVMLIPSVGSSGVFGQDTKVTPLPPDVTACDVNALANDQTPQGLKIRAKPQANSTILGRLLIIENIYHEKIAADVHIIGAKKGWFLIEGAAYGGYDLPKKNPHIYSGRGWVSGRLLSTTVQAPWLKAGPDNKAANVVELPGEVQVSSFLDCDGRWFRVETPLSTKEYTLKPTLPSDGPDNVIRGWAQKSCVNQRTTCDFGSIEE